MRCLPSIVTVLALALATFPLHASPAASPLHPPQPPQPSSPLPGFDPLPPHTSGIHFTNSLAPRDAARNQILLNGSGVAAGDIDGDGWVDLFFCGLSGNSQLFRNLGHARFTNITTSSGTHLPHLHATGAAFADVNGNGHLDLLVNAVGQGTTLLLNDGSGRFTLSPNSGLSPRFGPTSLALADIDRDGDLDLYVANYRTNTIRSSGFSVLNVGGQRRIRPEDQDRLEYLPDGRILEHGEPDILYLNDGRGQFTPVPWTTGRFLDATGQPLSRPPFDWSLSAAFRDLNQDGWTDLYVCGDFHSPDRLWLNDRSGRFRAAPSHVLRNTPTFSMAVDFADLDRDGHDDLFVADMRDPLHALRMIQSVGPMATPGDYESSHHQPQLARNTLHLNRGDATFAEIAHLAGLDATGWTWSVAFLDVDLDGYEDLLTTTGHLFDTQDLDAQERIDAAGPYRPDQIPGKLLQYPPLLSQNLAFRNLGNLRFQDASTLWNWSDDPDVSHGMCLADLDNDGDLDVIVNRLNAPAAVFLNRSTAPRVAVALRGLPPNTHGIGARLFLHGGAVPSQSQEMAAGGRYLSSDQPLRVFATGSTTNPLHLEVRWPSGRTSSLTNIHPHHHYLILETEASPSPPAPPTPHPTPSTLPLFSDQSTRLGHRHFDAPFDDFQRQPLLPFRLSQAGPGLAWFDLNGDQLEDLFLPAGRGGRPTLFLNSGDGTFSLLEFPPAPRDQIAAVGWIAENAARSILVSSSAYEDIPGPPLHQFLPSGESSPLLPADASSTGPLALADIDGDGDLDLFLGGQALAGRFPLATPSRIFERRENRWILHPVNSATVADAGPVQAALWTDLNADGFPELVLANTWGPLRVFLNHQGLLREATDVLGFSTLTGWWTGLASGDFDGDGRLDLAAGNWGLNSPYLASPQQPVRLYFGNLSGQGHMDLVEAVHDPSLNHWAPLRDLASMTHAFPWLRTQFPTHRSYGQASVEQILSTCPHPARLLQTTTLASTVFLNRGDHFLPIPLPDQAQRSAVFGLVTADFNLDGHLDLFLAQNFFAVSSAISRQDAGRGLLLLGQGHGQFQPIDAHQSGLAIYGEQRGAAFADYDGDGRPDLAVTQNRGETRLFRNQSSNPGLRIRLQGPPGNPYAIGASLRLVTPGHTPGPTQIIQAGSSYASHSSPILCIPFPPSPSHLEVRWPGGQTSTHPIPPNVDPPSMTLLVPPSATAP